MRPIGKHISGGREGRRKKEAFAKLNPSYSQSGRDGTDPKEQTSVVSCEQVVFVQRGSGQKPKWTRRPNSGWVR